MYYFQDVIDATHDMPFAQLSILYLLFQMAGPSP